MQRDSTWNRPTRCSRAAKSRVLLITVALALACGGRSPARAPAPTAPQPAPDPADRADDGTPNVLIVIADDVGIDKVGAYGEHPSPPPTPTLDALAAEGVLFRNAYAYPSCSPTRAATLTGRYGERTGIGAIIDSWKNEWELQPDETTLAELLGDRDSSLAGKWHLGSMQGQPAPLHPGIQGFDWHAGSMGNPKDKWPHDRDMGLGYDRWNKNDNGEVREVRTYMTTDSVDDALARMSAMAEPWLLVLSFNAAHYPPHVPPADLHTRPGLTDRSSEADRYDAVVEAMDTEIGRLLDTADAELLDRTTLLVFGDNGTPDFAIRAPWDPKRSKGSLYEGGINVPLIVAGAGITAPGQTDALVHVVDVFATVAEIAGVDPPADIDGVSFWPHVLDPARASTRQFVYTSKFKPNGPGPPAKVDAIVRDADYKLVVSTKDDGSVAERLYALDGGSGLEGPNLLRNPNRLAPAARAALEALRAEHARIQASF